MPITTYSDISPRTMLYAAVELLKRGLPFLVLEQFGQGRPLPRKSSKTQTWRKYTAFDPTPKYLTEGVTPVSEAQTKSDVSATLIQLYGGTTITDVILDTHEDPILQDNLDNLAEQAAVMVERYRWGIVRAGTNVFYAGQTVVNTGTRATVSAVVSRAYQRRIVRYLKSQYAMPITKFTGSNPNYLTQSVLPTYIALCSTDLEGDIRSMDGFIDVKQYQERGKTFESEIGAVENVRYLTSQVFTAFADSGPAYTGTYISTSGAQDDVYPILYIGRDSYGIVPLKGKEAITPMIVQPKASDSDPWAQRGWITWKSYQAAAVLQDPWMVRGEVLCTR